MAIDPGLLQMGERDADEASRNKTFTAKIAFPSFSAKRIELQYQERLPIENYESLRRKIKLPIVCCVRLPLCYGACCRYRRELLVVASFVIEPALDPLLLRCFAYGRSRRFPTVPVEEKC